MMTENEHDKERAAACTRLRQSAAGIEDALAILATIEAPRLVDKEMRQNAAFALTKLRKAVAWHCDEAPLTPEEMRARAADEPGDEDGGAR